MTVNGKRFALVSHPVGEPSEDNFRLESVQFPDPQPGQILIRSQYLSLDPYVRGRISGVDSYEAAIPLGSPPPGAAVGVVEVSNDESFAPGDIVSADLGWQTHGLVKAGAARKLDPATAPVTTALGMYFWTALSHGLSCSCFIPRLSLRRSRSIFSTTTLTA